MGRLEVVASLLHLDCSSSGGWCTDVLMNVQMSYVSQAEQSVRNFLVYGEEDCMHTAVVAVENGEAKTNKRKMMRKLTMRMKWKLLQPVVAAERYNYCMMQVELTNLLLVLLITMQSIVYYPCTDTTNC